MADDSAYFTFVGLLNDAFYFDDFVPDEVDTDTFEYSDTKQYLVRSHDNRFLIFNKANQFELKDLNVEQQSCSDYKLNINIYRDLGCQQSISGRAVVLYALKDDKKYAAVCKNDKEVVPEEVKELQSRIEESQHKAVFYMVRDQQPDKYKLKSSLYTNKALGFDEMDSKKLILRDFDSDSQDDTITVN